jgi:hypothetical protein
VRIVFLPLLPGEGWGEGIVAVETPLILSFSLREKGLSVCSGAHYLVVCSVTGFTGFIDPHQNEILLIL